MYTLHYTFHNTVENFSACCNTSCGIKLAASQADRLRSACSLGWQLPWWLFHREVIIHVLRETWSKISVLFYAIFLPGNQTQGF